MSIQILCPDYVQAVLHALHDAGHEAYVVGGCVRDSLLGATPKDWDICTSALPEQIMAVSLPLCADSSAMRQRSISFIMGVEMYSLSGKYGFTRSQ